ncbi:MAG: phosphatase PAP2 family protein [Coxiellaceae bacterium]|nr:phosphatase PAP2 family protein [Coxiellaceae bacterium]
MKIIPITKTFFKNYSTRTDRVFLWLTLLTLLCGGLCSALNQLFFHYPTILLFATHIDTLSWFQTAALTFLCGGFLFYGMTIRTETPRASTFLWGLGLFSWCAFANLVVINGIQSTPFTPIDPLLVKIDHAFGIHSAALMAWTHNHPFIHDTLNFIYKGLVLELIGIPLALTLFNGRHALSIFYLAFMMTCLIGCFIYYFFPTMAPSGIIHSPYFSHEQQDTSMRFHQIHAFIKPTVADGGLIAFPSFHVIWAVLLTYACRARKLFLYPVAIFNVLLIISTVMLGWHYVTDVIGGIIIAVFGIIWAEWITTK